MLTVSEKVDCKTDLLAFTKTIFKSRKGYDFIENWHHRLICNVLERVFIGDIKFLIINLPPRYSKTELAVINFVAWSLGICPDSEFIHASYSKQLAAYNSGETRAVVESEIYREIFENVTLNDLSKAKAEWRTKQGGMMYASGSEGTIIGYGAGKMRRKFGGAIIIDDPHKATEANSAVRRQNVIDWYMNTMQSRANDPQNTPRILIMQRLHELDLAGFLLNGGDGRDWYHLIIPALSKDNVPLWPLKHGLEDLETMKRTDPYVFTGQYMQRPSPKGGGLFRDEWWKFYKVTPNVEFKIITGDTAQKTKEHNDYSVFQCWGMLENNIYLLDQIRGKWEAPELRMRFVAFWNKHHGTGTATRGNLRAAYIEDKASATGLMQDIWRKESIPVVAVQRNIDKVTRAHDMVHYIASGYVYLPEDAVFLSDYLSEFSRFTPLMVHPNDDQIDPTLDAIDILLRPAKSEAGTW